MYRPRDLLLKDTQLRQIDGYTLARTLQTRGSRLPIVALMAHAISEDRLRCVNAECDDYPGEPIAKDKLLAVCERSLGRTNTFTACDATAAARTATVLCTERGEVK